MIHLHYLYYYMNKTTLIDVNEVSSRIYYSIPSTLLFSISMQQAVGRRTLSMDVSTGMLRPWASPADEFVVWPAHVDDTLTMEGNFPNKNGSKI